MQHIPLADWAKPNWGTDYKIVPMEAGPYHISGFVTGDHVTLTANPYYWRGRPKIQTIIVKTVANSAALFSQVQAGDIQGTTLLPADVNVVDRSRFTVYSGPGASVIQLDLNLKRPYFADRRVRQALLYAIDRAGIARVVYSGQADVPNADMQPVNPYYDPRLTPYRYDPSRVKALMTAAGWKPGADGVLAKNGTRFAFTVQYPVGNALYNELATITQQNLAAVGITMRVLPTDPTILNRVYDPKDKTIRQSFDAILTSYDSGPSPNLRYFYFCGASLNLSSYCNPALDQAIVATETAIGFQAQQRAQFSTETILNQDLPHLYLEAPRDLWVMDKRIQGFTQGYFQGLQSAWQWHWSS